MFFALARQLPKSAILVALFLEENGRQPVGRIAEACGLSESSVYAALSSLRKSGHDHDLSFMEKEGAVQPAGAAVQDSGPVDPLEAELVDLGIFPEAARRLIDRSGREAVALQVAYHRHRLASGYAFRKAPAALLYRACENPGKFPPPEGFLEEQREAMGNVVPDKPRSCPVVAASPAPVPAAPESTEERLAWVAGELARARRTDTIAARKRAIEATARRWGIPWELVEARAAGWPGDIIGIISRSEPGETRKAPHP